MKTLLIMRHAKSSWDNYGISDHDRPLNGRGKRDAPRMGELLKQEELTPQLIISSTAERAFATAEAVALASEYEGEIQLNPRFYHADPEVYVEALAGVSDALQRVMVVGHNPGMADLVDMLADVDLHFTTANIAQIELPISSWTEMTLDTMGQLKNWWQPRELA